MITKPYFMTENYQLIDSKWLAKNIDLFLKKNIVILTGAGISVSSGIPDFRSKDGIFSTIKSTHKTNGKDLFQYRFGHEKDTQPIYYKFISELKEMTDLATPSPTHSFLCKYRKYNKKYRIYTQNIDSLEAKAGIQPENLVYLHGNLDYLICTMCGHRINYTEEVNEFYKKGKEIVCTRCERENVKRKENKIRLAKVGYYHTNIIHYDQPHHDAYKIARLFEGDMDLDLFIVMGTSLKVYGVKEMVKRGLRKVRLNNGKGVFVNLEEPSREFKEMFDYFWKGECDTFCDEILKNIEILKVDKRLSILNVKDEDASVVKINRKSNAKETKIEKLKPSNAESDVKLKASREKDSYESRETMQGDKTNIKTEVRNDNIRTRDTKCLGDIKKIINVNSEAREKTGKIHEREIDSTTKINSKAGSMKHSISGSAKLGDHAGKASPLEKDSIQRNIGSGKSTSQRNTISSENTSLESKLDSLRKSMTKNIENDKIESKSSNKKRSEALLKSLSKTLEKDTGKKADLLYIKCGEYKNDDMLDMTKRENLCKNKDIKKNDYVATKTITINKKDGLINEKLNEIKRDIINIVTFEDKTEKQEVAGSKVKLVPRKKSTKANKGKKK